MATKKQKEEAPATPSVNHIVHHLARKEIRAAAKTISEREVRMLVSEYYRMQDNRKRSASQAKSLADREDTPPESNILVSFMGNQAEYAEDMIKKALDDYTMSHPVGKWMREIYGIGPVTAAGLLAHIDISVCPTVGHIWSYGGYNPNMKWNEGEVRPFNADLKKLFWHIGQAFMKFSGKEECVYGKLYLQRKEFEVARNESGGNAAQAKAALSRYSKSTDAYGYVKEGKLPPAQIDARARRWAVKIFLSHLHQFWYQHHFNEPAPKPFAIAILGHAHTIPMPNAA